MLNSVTLVGRLASDPVFREVSNGKNVCEIRLAVQRPFKNQTNHTYDTDFIKVTFWEYLAINVNEYCFKGATVAVRARLQIRNVTIADKNIEMPEVVGEQIIFISKPQSKVEIKSDEVVEDIPFEEVNNSDL